MCRSETWSIPDIERLDLRIKICHSLDDTAYKSTRDAIYSAALRNVVPELEYEQGPELFVMDGDAGLVLGE